MTYDLSIAADDVEVLEENEIPVRAIITISEGAKGNIRKYQNLVKSGKGHIKSITCILPYGIKVTILNNAGDWLYQDITEIEVLPHGALEFKGILGNVSKTRWVSDYLFGINSE